MKILQIFGAVVAVHVLAFIFIFASPGCQSGPRNIPTPDATAPSSQMTNPVTFNAPTPVTPVDMGTNDVAYNPGSPSGHASPTRPGSPNAAAVTPPKPVAEVAPVSTYTVGRGDSLWSIAKKHNMSVAELAKSNNLGTGATLQPGKKLIVPGKASAPQDLAATSVPEKATVAEKATAPRASGETVKHTVLPGESLGVIARKFGVTTQALALENNITDPAKVRAGQQLTIPGGRKATTAKSSTSTTGTPASNAANTPATAADTSAQPAATTPPANVPHFEIAPPPPGQDLDAGLKETSAEVPTIKVDDQPPKK
jgi:LysM repeat protein